MINIYDSKETNFNNNGLAIISKNAISCVVAEEGNSGYNLVLEYPIIKDDKKFAYLKEENIIKAPTPKSEGQLFRITHVKRNTKTITITANHIFYDLLGYFIEDTRPTGQSGISAIQNILDGTVDKHRFSSNSNISRVNTAFYIRKNVVESLISDLDQSFLNRWGGELERDNFNIKINDVIGQDRGFEVKYGKNLESIEENIDMTSIVTKVMVTGLNENDTTLMLPEKYIESKYINNYANISTKEFHYTELKVDTEKGITKEIIFEKLREQARDLFEVQKIDLPKFNYKINFVELSKTEEYKNYSILQQIYLYDIVAIEHKILNLDLKAKVISYKYDAIANKYLEIELGDFKDNISSSFTKIENTLKDVSNLILQNKTDLEKAIDRASDLIKNSLGGYVLKRNGELLIMDTEDVNTAKQCWRFGLNGLGYSSTGYNGKYELAMTMDGAINASFITTGYLNAERIKGRIICSDELYITNKTNDFRINEDGINIRANKLNMRFTQGVMDMETKFQINDEKIASNVKKGEFGTYVEQNAYSVKIAWNKVSNYVQFENGSLAIYNGALTTNQKRAVFDENGNHFWRDGYYLGKIGTNSYSSDTSIKGIVFNLENNGGYMSWSVLPYAGATNYNMIWTYANKKTDNYDAGALHAGCDIDMHNYTLRNVKFSPGGINGTLNCVQIKEMASDGTVQKWSNNLKMVFQNGILIDGSWSNS